MKVLFLFRLFLIFIMAGSLSILAAEKSIKLAQQAFRAKDFGKVVSLMTAAIEKDNRQPMYYKLRGYASYKLNKFDQAIADYNQAEKLDAQKDETLYNNRGLAYARAGKCTRAIKDFETALRLKPAYGQAHLNLGNCHDMLGNKPKACSHYQKAAALRHPGAARSLQLRCR